MANEQNLHAGHRFTKENAKEMGSRGGRKSNELYRERKQMMTLVNDVLNMALYSGKVYDIDGIKNLAAAKGKNLDVQTAIIIAQIQKALKGDTTAASWLRDTAGQKPSERIDAEVGATVIFSGENELED